MVERFSNICRICLQKLEENVQFCFLNNENGLMLQSKLLNFLPEIDLKVTQNPIICKRCTTTIDAIYKFKQLCLRTQSIIKDLVKMQHKPFKDILNYVTKDTVHETIKDELVEDTVVDEPQIADNVCLQVNTDLPLCIKIPSQMQQKLVEDVLSHIKKDTIVDFKDTITGEQYIVDDSCLQVNTDQPVCIETPTKPLYYCYTCNYNTVTKSYLAQHVDTHRPQPHQCNICNYKCATRYKLTVHMRSHTSNKQYKCTKCDYKTVYKGRWRCHQLSHKNIKLLVCNMCHFNTRSKAGLRTHMLTHRGVQMHKCNQCDFSSMFKCSLKQHMLIHEGLKPFVCGTCGYSCRQRSNLTRHMKRHSIVKKYKCDKCDYSFKLKRSLKRHMIFRHNRKKLVKNHKCNVCEYATNNKTALNVHIRLHTGEKPYKCNICDCRYTRNSNLKKHLNTHAYKKIF